MIGAFLEKAEIRAEEAAQCDSVGGFVRQQGIECARELLLMMRHDRGPERLLGFEVMHDQRLRDALLLHDIGKIGVPDRVLLKEAPLDDEEWELMKKHSEWGAKLLDNFETYRDIANIVLSHQERYDGNGYPQGLAGEQIPLEARIIGVADAFHAMTADRPYRKALSPAHAAREILKNRGTQFDPDLANAFVRGLLREGDITEADLDGLELPDVRSADLH